MRAIDAYNGSDGEATKALYAELMRSGPIGDVAVNLFRAQKCSARAKVYRGGVRGKGSYKGMAYDRKQWSLDNLCKVLGEHGATLGIDFGWKEDPHTVFGNQSSWVFYVDIPQGQVSFHAPNRGKGPDYLKEWDGQRGMSIQRVIDFAESVLRGSLVLTAGSNVGEDSPPWW